LVGDIPVVVGGLCGEGAGARCGGGAGAAGAGRPRHSRPHPAT